MVSYSVDPGEGCSPCAQGEGEGKVSWEISILRLKTNGMLS